MAVVKLRVTVKRILTRLEKYHHFECQRYNCRERDVSCCNTLVTESHFEFELEMKCEERMKFGRGLAVQ